MEPCTGCSAVDRIQSGMMETILNIAWVSVSLLALVAGVLHQRAREGRVHSLLLVAISLVGVALLLFPAISLTDDLNPVIFASESSSKRDLATCAGYVAPVIPALPDCRAFAQPEIALVHLGAETRNRIVAITQPGFAWTVPGRAPPRAL